ncbi:MAG TPA: amidase [Solirubrobacteraceae bacterium]|nr:amidase [Solirubrobacteraceae bacterium]
MTATEPHTDVDLAFAGPGRLAALIRTGEVTSRELTELYLDRIFRLDQRLNAFRVVLGERALAEADAADAARRNGDERPLLGVPIAVKDDMDLAGETTTYGAVATRPPAQQDSAVVRRLRDAGAVVLGKTNVPELMTMNFTETEWYGATRNPWDLDRTPGGSSGGSAAAVAAGLAAAATASDGAGSIRIPAAACGLVGLKPQRGRVPTPRAWHGLSTYGVLARTVADAALLYDVIKDGDGSWAAAASAPPRKLRVALSTVVPKPVMARADAEQERGVRTLADALRDLGHEVVERDPDYGPIYASVIPRYLRGIHDDAKEMPDPRRLQRRTRGLARMGSLIPEAALQRALRREAADRERLNALFGEFDLLLTPAWTARPWRIGALEAAGGPRSLDAATRMTPYEAPWNHTGQPAIAVPAAQAPDGFPVGAQLVAPPDGEPLLLSVAAQLEAALQWPSRRPPSDTPLQESTP